MLDAVWNRLTREAYVRASFFLPDETRRRIERRARGREEVHNLRRADYVVVSYGKSGRTWLRVMLSRFYQQRYGLPEQSLLGFDNLHRVNPAVPKVLFTHDNYIRDYTGQGESKADYRGKKVILLVRHPADTAVSQYFQWRYRMRPGKKALNNYPPHGAELPIFDFVMHHEAGLRKIVVFLNEWANALPHLDDVLVVRYEDMRAAPDAALRRILTYVGQEPTDAEISDAVAFASFDNMKKLESQRVFWRSGSRLLPKNKANPESYKVRRAKVGGYRDYFDDEQVRQIDGFIREHLAPAFASYCEEGVRGDEGVTAGR